MTTFGRLSELPEGTMAPLTTLRAMAALIVSDEPGLLGFVDGILATYPEHEVSDVVLARSIFDWTRAHFQYQEDQYDARGGVFADESLQSPGVTADQIARQGYAVGDCDDYVIWLGAVYRGLGFPIALVAVSTAGDRQLDHVYLRVYVGGAWRGADAIPDAAGVFGWEPGPAEGVTHTVEWAV
jgi:hypothetical protein